MTSRVLAFVVAVLSASCAPKEGDRCERSGDCGSRMQCVEEHCRPYGAVGDVCSASNQCEQRLDCAEARCVRLAKAGEPCSKDYGTRRRCDNKLTCFEDQCMSAKAWKDVLAEREAVARLAEEKRMLEASGATPTTAEKEQKEMPSSPQAGSVRVVKVEGKEFVFAACRETERLIGGGCGNSQGGPAEFTATDTIAARWECKNEYPTPKLTATALCALIEPPKSPPTTRNGEETPAATSADAVPAIE